MSDLIPGPAAGGARGGTDGPFSGGAPLVLLGALGAAVLIAITLIALFGGFGGGGSSSEAVSARDTGTASAGTGEPPQRVKLLITLRGSGRGEVRIAPGDSTCDRSCERRYDTDTRVTVTATAATGSTFEGWGDSCDGTGSCSFRLDEQRSLTATFAGEASEPSEAVPPPPAASDEDPDAGGGDLDEDLDAAAPGDCADNRDNDGDGLTDTEQDPDCAAGNTEAGGVAAPPPPPPPPPPARANDDCSDGRDNDGDGLTDTAQDPDCVAGRTESGKTKRKRSTQRARSECRDGKDNDGDGLTDREQDPGCIEDGSES